MESLFPLDVASRILHVLTAIALIGGSIFTACVLGPALRNLPETAAMWESIQRRWKPWVHGGIALFLLTGFYNYVRAMPLHRGDGLYHALLGTKMLLAFAIMFLASVLVGRSPGFQAMRDRAGLWQGLLIGMAVVVVAISGFVKVRTWQKLQPAVEQSQAAVEEQRQAAGGESGHWQPVAAGDAREGRG